MCVYKYICKHKSPEAYDGDFWGQESEVLFAVCLWFLIFLIKNVLLL